MGVGGGIRERGGCRNRNVTGAVRGEEKSLRCVFDSLHDREHRASFLFRPSSPLHPVASALRRIALI